MKKFAQKYSLGAFGFFYNLFIASLLLVVTANNGLYFLFVWELMSLTSYFLVIFENKIQENIKAGLLYLVMTHVGTAFILLVMILLYNTLGTFDFDSIRQQAGSIPLVIKNIIFIAALVGFGTKAGIIPLHIWLPRAHPAAPSQVSSLMSGVMIKTAIFMLIRLFIDLIPSEQLWWGLSVLLIGAVSSILGVLYALSEHDIKKLLAYHSVENIGIILMGLGSAMTFVSLGFIPLAVLAVAASLYHTMNHAVFKSLLFLGAGSVVYQTHTHNIEEYGGLIKKMPYTAFFFLIGALAISAVPPLNGFSSEWLTYQSLFAGLMAQASIVKVTFILAIASLVFTGGLAAACFVKAFAITFLAKPRSKEAEHAHESPLVMRISMGILAALCLALGIFSGWITLGLTGVAQTLGSLSHYVPGVTPSALYGVEVGERFASINSFSVLMALIGVFTLVVSIVYIKTRHQGTKRVDTWDCGAPPLTVRAEITATAFSRSIITIFSGILKPTKHHSIEYREVDVSRYFPQSKTVTLGVPNLYEQYLYQPLHQLLSSLSRQTRFIQSGDINQYLLYIFITVIGLLVWARY
jgi:hydrogenase-4 component B